LKWPSLRRREWNKGGDPAGATWWGEVGGPTQRPAAAVDR
jgi:hypothetical protein